MWKTRFSLRTVKALNILNHNYQNFTREVANRHSFQEHHMKCYGVLMALAKAKFQTAVTCPFNA